MNTSTGIATAARRIARTVNATPKEVTVAFDADGRQVDAHSTGLWYADPSQAPQYAVKLPGCKNARDRLTGRQAQDLLDAAAHAGEHPDDTCAAEGYLAELQFARDVARTVA